ncbi:hypothetical protein [Streptomyces roseoverticillatus]|uniref:Uncharacterized protein n=1 Tax=Streptomyces roseoverticillatus TaxID=66429 RepID=A0ABV3IXA5_9ACTN
MRTDPFRGQPDGASDDTATSTREQCATLLVRTHDWLERAIAQAPDVNGLVPLVTQAVHLYRKGEYVQSLRLANGVRQAILLARGVAPGLPTW